MTKKFAQIIRVITVPPVIVLGFLLLLFFKRDDVFSGTGQLLWSIVFLMLVPISAYPLSYIIPQFKNKGRDGQRNLAFILSLFGYSVGLIYALLFCDKTPLLIIFLTYFLSVIILIFLNKIIKIRASGHACSISGPLVSIIYFFGYKSIIWCLIILALVIWSSLILKRHTLSELIFGTISPVIALLTSLLITSL